MERNGRLEILAAIGVALLVGCAGDPAGMMKTNENVRGNVLGAIATDSVLVSRMVDTLLDNDQARAILIDKVTTDGEAMQALMAKIAREPTAVDGIIGLAVQESTMKAHVLTLLKGIQIGQGQK